MMMNSLGGIMQYTGEEDHPLAIGCHPAMLLYVVHMHFLRFLVE